MAPYAAAAMVETHHTFCRICEALCGLEVDIEGGRAVATRPDPAHVATRGFGCTRGCVSTRSTAHRTASPGRWRAAATPGRR
ncbi:MAG: hypothetical protein H6744_13050 [Deltaproteobacteria bacterium]|nr:hypothetical protein [Deltaproteobacteria bacterium]